jgi:hypothetical protein
MAARWWDGGVEKAADGDARTHVGAVSVHGCRFWRCVRMRPGAGRSSARCTAT